MSDELAALEHALGHEFENQDLLRLALTHRSYANERRAEGVSDNERLEFLGDAVIGVVASSMLYERFPSATEGELTRRRADLVCEASLAAIAREMALGPALLLGRGELRTGGREKPRLLASAFEACLGALFLDAGIATAMRVTRAIFEPRIDQTAPGAGDFKSRVQELVQARGVPAPRYEIVGTEGPDHARRFFVAMKLGASTIGEGNGRSKGDAEQAAARSALERGIDTWLPPNAVPAKRIEREDDYVGSNHVDDAYRRIMTGDSLHATEKREPSRPIEEDDDA